MSITFHVHHQGAPGANNLRGGWGPLTPCKDCDGSGER